mmetsp:Transcript_24421/g.59809  ORF Transcript_24421/g.59809 Transcript_24421/m.59809 type:complete len:168 (+) Transcript_24421:33-536(+)
MIPYTQEELFHSSFTKTDFENDFKRPALPIEQEQRRVTFAPRDEIFEIPHIDDLSDEEVEDVWMSPDDFAEIRRECQTIVMMIEHQSSLLKGIELRGLEHHMLSQRRHTEELQDLLYETVDNLMHFNEETSMDVSDMLAEMCQKISSRSEALARKTALQDEMNAQSS